MSRTWFQSVWKLSSQSHTFPSRLETFFVVKQLSWKFSRQSRNFQNLESFKTNKYQMLSIKEMKSHAGNNICAYLLQNMTLTLLTLKACYLDGCWVFFAGWGALADDYQQAELALTQNYLNTNSNWNTNTNRIENWETKANAKYKYKKWSSSELASTRSNLSSKLRHCCRRG